jgi:ribosomal protein S15P/S13E
MPDDTEERLAEIERKLGAGPGPHCGCSTCWPMEERNEDIAWLIAEVRRLRDHLHHLMEMTAIGMLPKQGDD